MSRERRGAGQDAIAAPGTAGVRSCYGVVRRILTEVPDMASLDAELPVSEQLERGLLKGLHEAAPAPVREALGLAMWEQDGGLVSLAANDPSIMLNRALGFGLAAPFRPDTIRAIGDSYREAGIARFFLEVHPGARPGDWERMLREAGLRRHRRWVKFERGAEPPPRADSPLLIREISAHHATAFGRIAAAGFDLSEKAGGLFAGLIGRPGFHLYMSFEGERPVGTALLYLQGDNAWLDWGATDPAFRKRGSQRALMARRINDALAAGCCRLFTCTGEAVPGDPQHSYHNIEWGGFRADCLCDNWIPG